MRIQIQFRIIGDDNSVISEDEILHFDKDDDRLEAMGAWQSVGDDQAAVGTAISLLLAAMAGYQEVNRSRSVPLRVRVRVCRSR